jgi:hypothetical protein
MKELQIYKNVEIEDIECENIEIGRQEYLELVRALAMRQAIMDKLRQEEYDAIPEAQ